MANGTRTINVIRHHPSVFAPGRHSRLRPVLDRALATAGARSGRWRIRQADSPIDFLWNRPSPLVILRGQSLIHHHWQISPTLLVNIGRSLLPRTAHLPIQAAGGPGWAPTLAHDERGVPLGSTGQRLMTTTERRLETRIVDRTLSVLRSSVEGQHSDAAPHAAAAALPLQPLPISVRSAQSVARSEMVFAQAARPAAVTAAMSSMRASDAVPASSPRFAAPPQLREIQLERVTDDVIRVLDARVIAWRERMGRS